MAKRALSSARLVALTLAVHLTAAPLVVHAQPAAPTNDAAKAALANGDKAARAKDWAKALSEYEAANKAQPSADALEGIANAHAQTKNDAVAYATYEEWKRTYGPKAAKPKNDAIDARMKEIASRTGELTISLEDPSAAGATVLVDDKPAPGAATPKGYVLRLPPGPHRVRVTKDGFGAFDQVPNVAAGASATLAVKLEALATKGRLSVKEKTNKPIRVTVDGVDMGDAPWTGDVDPGAHDVAGRGPGVVAAPEKVTIERGKTKEVELVASSSIATVKVATSDGKGLIYLDDKAVGEGTFTSEIPSGQHTIKITREGYDPFEETIELKDKETLARTITLKLSSKIETSQVQQEGRRMEGVYGGFGLLYTALPSGMKHSMARTCEASDKPAELTSCDGTGGSVGGGVTGVLGYHWDPVGIELFMAVNYDQNAPTLEWAASSTDPGFGADPARTEEFNVRRVGGLGALRIRLTHQWEKIRLTAAAGVGLSYRVMFLDRDATAKNVPGARDVYVPDSQSYVSPVLSFEPQVQYRLTATTAIGLGLQMLVESPRAFDQTPTAPAEGGHRLCVPNASPPQCAGSINTPRYELASGTQVYMGPFIGMTFGP
ncbi:MAG: PEGA domain-containing protein [Deltaproteobacteria bacterium]|nr:PEGA domain-containing protein [Deltaproteobacteria bacterium]